MSHYSNPTANMALGSVERELKQMKKEAKYIRRLHRMGLLTPEDLAWANRRFTGIYRRFLLKALAD